jgi:hypothetical protein
MTRITDLRTFREVLQADERHDEEPIYHQAAKNPVLEKHPVGQHSVQDTLT